MRPFYRSAAALIAATSLVLAACGGDDAAGPAVPPPGAGDIDLSDLADLGDLDLEDFDPDDFDLDDLMSGLDDFVSGFGGDGAGTVTVDGVTYAAAADVCFHQFNDFFFDGPATGSDGSVAWVTAEVNVTTRAEMAEFMDEPMLSSMFPEGVDELESASISVAVGHTGRFDMSDDQPRWAASADGDFMIGELQYAIQSGTFTGSGAAVDEHYVVGDFDDTVPIEFQVSCG